jgi:shikimate dehydrogenase
MLNDLNGETRLYPIVGDPIGQVKAPAGLTCEFERRGRNAAVLPFHVMSADFDAALSALSVVRNVDGLIATVPHKFSASLRCATLSDRARLLGAVNVMRRNTDGTWHGDMLDGLALVNGIEAAGRKFPGARVLLAGAGGAGSAIALSVLDRGAAGLWVHDIDPARRDLLIDKIKVVHPGKMHRGSAEAGGFDIVVNATPLGMSPDDPLPFNTEGLTSATFVGEVITRPEVTPLLSVARSKGCQTETGVGMFNSSIGLMADFFLGST